MIKAFFLFLLLPCFANAHVNVTDIKIKPALMAGYPTTVYFSLENDSDQLDYLLEVKSINFPSSKITIHKTIIEKNIARIIQIDRLSIPAHTKLNSLPLKIYLVIEEIPTDARDLKLKFIFANEKTQRAESLNVLFRAYIAFSGRGREIRITNY